MKAETQYDDLHGTTAADISDFISNTYGGGIADLGKHFKINEERFKVVGVELYGTDNISLSFICVDKERSTPGKEFIVNMSIDLPQSNNTSILSTLFKRLSIVLYDKFDTHYCNLDIDCECSHSDFH